MAQEERHVVGRSVCWPPNMNPGLRNPPSCDSLNNPSKRNRGNSARPRDVYRRVGTLSQLAPERFKMFRARSFALLLGTLAFGGCAVAPPAGPTVLALPPAGKDLAQFQRDDATCRGYAQQQIGYGSPQQAANQSAVGSAVAGTAVGAAAGAAIGAAAGNPGAGAAIGAGAGLLTGSAVGAGNASATAVGLQRRYDVAYAQCMAANGDQPQALAAAWPYGYGPYGYPYLYPAYYDYWFGPALGLNFFGGVEASFHHHGFSHHGSHRG
jgi:hypothetical protein